MQGYINYIIVSLTVSLTAMLESSDLYENLIRFLKNTKNVTDKIICQ